MVTAIVLLNVARARVSEVADKLASTEGISEVYSVAGRFDLVAMVRVKTNEDLADIVTTRKAHRGPAVFGRVCCEKHLTSKSFMSYKART